MSSSQTPHPRIVITGLGAVTNLGFDAAATWDSMVHGRSGITPVQGAQYTEGPFADKWSVKIGGQIHGWAPDGVLEPREAKKLDRCAQLGLVATDEAVRSCGLDFSNLADPTRAGVVIGTGIGGVGTIVQSEDVRNKKGPNRMSPFTVPRLMANSCTGHVSIRYGLEGPSTTHCTACASAGHAIGDALRIMQRGEADLMLAGGAEGAFLPLCLGAFMTMKALSTRNDAPEKASRPFDRDRDGFLLAEGAATLVLETEAHARARGATALGEVVGYAATSDASHITAPAKSGAGAQRAMRHALVDACIAPESVDYINAHGTSTPLGDAAEVAAVSSVFGAHACKGSGGVLMSSTKSMHGHTLGASGAVEMVACLGAIRHGLVPPTTNLDSPDDGFGLDFVAHTAREKRVDVVMNNTFGFGGHNVALVVRRYEG